MKKWYGLPYKEYRKIVRGGNLLIKVNKNTGNLEHINKATGKTLYVDKNYVRAEDDNVRPPKGLLPGEITPEMLPPKPEYKPPPGYNKFGVKITEVKPPKTTTGHPPPKVAPTGPTSSGPTREGFALARTDRRPKEEKGVLMTDKDTRSNLRIKKKQGKRKFKIKKPFVGGLGSSSIGLS